MAEDKRDEKGGERTRPSLLSEGGTPFRGGSGGGWVVVSFIGPAGVDVTELAVRMLRGGTTQSPPLAQRRTPGTAAANGGTRTTRYRKTAGGVKRTRKT
jgi:hypothetical protein